MLKKITQIIVIFIFFTSISYAADVEKYVNPTCSNNGDGSSASCATGPGDPGAKKSLCDLEATQDLVTATTSWRINVAGAGTDICDPDFSTWTTNATYDLEISGDGNYVLRSTNNSSPEVLETPQYITLRNFRIESNTTTNNQEAIQMNQNNSYIVIDSVIMEDIGNNGGDGIQQNGSDVTVIMYNSIIKGYSRDGFRMAFVGTNSTAIIYNNVFSDNGSDGFTVTNWNATGTEILALKNNIGYNNTAYGYWSEGAGANICRFITTCETDNNWTDHSYSPDGASYASATFNFTDAANEDYTIVSGDGSGGGVDLSADARFSFSDDIEGTTRVVPWDAGAFEAPLTTYDISGSITGDTLEGITVTCTPACGSDTTDVNGDYSITSIPEDTSYTLTPTLTDHTFSPTTITGTLTANVTNADFVSTDTTLIDKACGRDTNFSDSISNLCPADKTNDRDHDGFPSSQDCDDTNPDIFPGIKVANTEWTTGLEYSDGIEPGTASVCPDGSTCYYVDCDAVSDGTGTYNSPYWGFETVLGYESGGTFYQGVITSANDTSTIVFVKGTCDCSGSTESATGPFKQLKYYREMGDSSDPVTIKSYLGTSRAVFDGEDTCDSGIKIKNTSQAGGVRIQNILIQDYLISGIRVEEDYDYVDINSVEITGIKGDGTGTYGPVMIYHKDAATAQKAFLRNSYLHDNDKSAIGGLNNRGSVNYHSVYTANTSSLFQVSNTLVEDGAYCYRVKHYGGQMEVKESICRDAVGIALVRTNTFIMRNTVADNITFIDPVDATSNNGIVLDVENIEPGYQLTFKGYNNTLYKIPFLFSTPSVPADNVVIEWKNNIVDATTPTGKFMYLAQYAADSFDVSEYTGMHNIYNVSSASQTTFADINDTDYSFTNAMAQLGELYSVVQDPSLTDPDNHDYTSSIKLHKTIIGALKTDVSGCGVGEYRYCQSTGIWSSCSSIENYACSDDLTPVYADLTHGSGNQTIKFQAYTPGTDGNNLTFTITNDPSKSITIDGNDVTITADTSSDTVNDVIKYILADGSYRGVFNLSSDGQKGDGLITALSQTNLTGGSKNPTYTDKIWIDLNAFENGDGSITSPYNDLDVVSRDGSEEANAGDCVIVKGIDSSLKAAGTDSGKSMVYVRAPQLGTKTNPIRFTNWPGEEPELSTGSTYTSANASEYGFWLKYTSYVTVDNFRIHTLSGTSIAYGIYGDYASSGDLSGHKFIHNLIYNIDGISSSNSGGIDVQGNTIAFTGTAQAGASTTITLNTGASSTDDNYNGYLINTTGGTGSGQTKEITDYDGTTKIATVDSSWSVNPDATTTFLVYPGNYQTGVSEEIVPGFTIIRNNDIYDISSGVASNNVNGIVVFRPDFMKISYNVIANTTSAGRIGWSIKLKHADSDVFSQTEVDHNFLINARKYSGFAAGGVAGATANLWTHHNYVNMGIPDQDYDDLESGDNYSGAGCFIYNDQGGETQQINGVFEYNTCIGPPALIFESDDASSTLLIPVENFVWRKNISLNKFESTQSNDTAMLRISTYESDALYDEFVAANNVELDNNLYFNDQSQTENYNLWAAGGGYGDSGELYTSFASWQASDIGGDENKPAWETSSFEEDPQIDIYGVALSSNSTDKGWTADWTTTATTQKALVILRGISSELRFMRGVE